MNKQIKSALVSVYYKDGIETIIKQLHALGVTLYSTGGTQKFIEQLNIPVVAVESLTTYPSILGGRVKTLHPAVFGGILGRRHIDSDRSEMESFKIPEIDLVIVDLYPFEETVAKTNDEQAIIEKIDIGGVSLIRAAAKNFRDVMTVASTSQYQDLENIITTASGYTTLEQRKQFAARAFEVCADYDIAISNFFNPDHPIERMFQGPCIPLRYGENPHQQASFYGDLSKAFTQLHGKEISYNNLVDIDSAIQLIREFNELTFAVIKHTNVCGIASRNTVHKAWQDALAGDPESAFGGILICNGVIDKETAEAISGIFFEVLIASGFEAAALQVLTTKKTRILLQCHPESLEPKKMFRGMLNGCLVQDPDEGLQKEWKESGGRETTSTEKEDLVFANIVCKHLKSNAISLVKNKQLIGKGCGQTSRIDSLRQAIDKARQFNFDLKGAALASDAFFPFNDCVKMGHEAGITSFIQPGGSIRDNESIEFCRQNGLPMIITGMRHFKH